MLLKKYSDSGGGRLAGKPRWGALGGVNGQPENAAEPLETSASIAPTGSTVTQLPEHVSPDTGVARRAEKTAGKPAAQNPRIPRENKAEDPAHAKLLEFLQCKNR